MGKQRGKGSILKITLNSTLTAISKIQKMKPPSHAKGEIDTTSLDSTWEESDETIPKAKGISVTKFFDDTDATDILLEALAMAHDSGAGVACEYILPSANKYTFNGQIRDWDKQEIDIKSMYMVTFMLMPVGEVTFVPN